MTKYQWNLYELRDNIKLLEDCYKNTIDEDSKRIIMEHIILYKDMIKAFLKKDNSFLDDSLKNNNIIDLIKEQISSYQDNDISVINMILQSYLPFKNNYSSNYDLTPIPAIGSNEDLITIAKDFSEKMLPDNIKKDFNKVFDSKNIINFSYTKANADYSGMTTIDSILKKKYIYVSRVNQLLDLVILPHEAFHYLFNDFDTYQITDYNMYYTTEIEGNFANILFGDYFYRVSEEDSNYFNQYFLSVYYSGISELIIKNAFIDALKDDKHLRMNKFNKNIEYYGLTPFDTKEELLDFLITPLEVNIKYTLGYLVAIDLYYIYQKDPEFAFYLLKNIRFIKHENDINGLFRRNHITFMDDGYDNLKKYIKKIERQN